MFIPRVTFDDRQSYETLKKYSNYAGQSGSKALIWVERQRDRCTYLKACRVNSIWDEIKTIGLIRTIKQRICPGDPLLGEVMHFLRDASRLWSVQRFRYVATPEDEVAFDYSVTLLNHQARLHKIATVTFTTKSEVAQMKAQREKMEQERRAEQERRTQLERAQAEERKEEKAQPFREESAWEKYQKEMFVQEARRLAAPTASPAAPSRGNCWSEVSVTINGKTTSYSGNHQGIVHVHNDQIFIDGRRV